MTRPNVDAVCARHSNLSKAIMTDAQSNRGNKRGPNERADLAIVKGILLSYGLSPQRFNKAEIRSGRTPDYRLLRGDDLVAYCEVKSPRDDWLDNQLESAAPGTIVGGLRNDPTFNRLARMIETAVSQFDAVNASRSVPNILFFVNHDDLSNYGDLRETLTGMFFAKSGSRDPTVKNVSEGKIKDAKFRIDAYVWFDRRTNRIQGWMLNESIREHVDSICGMFGLDKTKILR